MWKSLNNLLSALGLLSLWGRLFQNCDLLLHVHTERVHGEPHSDPGLGLPVHLGYGVLHTLPWGKTDYVFLLISQNCILTINNICFEILVLLNQVNTAVGFLS